MLEFSEDHFIRLTKHMGKHVQAAPVSHSDIDRLRAVDNRFCNQLVQ
ncbi:Uncharacterised protein [Mycobacteroides abscessus subsp. abscessus]|nr:Uncharacterised protein [Mycobacteroides abscessus subsp. abscessus]